MLCCYQISHIVLLEVWLHLCECEFCSCYTFPHGNSDGNRFARDCSSSCDWVCNKSPCSCSLIFSLRIVAGHIIFQSFDNYVGDVSEKEHEERIDKTLDNEEHEVLRIILNFTPSMLQFTLAS